MPTPTYDLIESQVLTSTASEVTFSNIAGSYRDLILVIGNAKAVSGTYPSLRFNNDSGSNYSRISMGGRAGNTTASTSATTSALNVQTDDAISDGGNAIFIFHILDYAQTNKHKRVLARQSQYTTQSDFVWAAFGRWASTSAITSITCRAGSFSWEVGVSFTLYGIAG